MNNGILIKPVKNKFQVCYLTDILDENSLKLIGEYRTLSGAIRKANSMEFELYEDDIKLKNGIKLTEQKHGRRQNKIL